MSLFDLCVAKKLSGGGGGSGIVYYTGERNTENNYIYLNVVAPQNLYQSCLDHIVCIQDVNNPADKTLILNAKSSSGGTSFKFNAIGSKGGFIRGYMAAPLATDNPIIFYPQPWDTP